MTEVIDLSMAAAGTRFEARDGEVWTYIGPSQRPDVYEHALQGSDLVKCIFTREGHYWVAGESPHDLVRTMDQQEAAEGTQEPASWRCLDLPFGEAGMTGTPRRR